MSSTRHHASKARLAVLTAVALALLFSVAGPVTAKEKPELTVMTQNLYLGADLTPVLSAPNPGAFLVAVAGLYAVVQASDFPTRAAAIAAEIDRNDVDIVGLQEVAKYTTSGPGAPPSLDFLAILLEKLADRGLSFSVAAVGSNANVGPIPLISCSEVIVGACLISYEDRDAILVNNRTRHLDVTSAQSGRYVAQQSVAGPVVAISFDRGWVSIDGRLDGENFRFATSHLEIEAYPAIQEAQALEFLAGPANAPGAVIAVGDFNSAADGSTTASYELLTGLLDDSWVDNSHDRGKRRKNTGLTCCQAADLANAASALSIRIDLVLTGGGVDVEDVDVVGDTPFQGIAPRWASDHAGLVARIEID